MGIHDRTLFGGPAGKGAVHRLEDAEKVGKETADKVATIEQIERDRKVEWRTVQRLIIVASILLGGTGLGIGIPIFRVLSEVAKALP